MLDKFKSFLPVIFAFLGAAGGTVLLPSVTGPQPFYANDFCVITPVPTCVFVTPTPVPSPTPTNTPLPTSTPVPRPTITHTLPFTKLVAYPLHCEDMSLVNADGTYTAGPHPRSCPGITGFSLVRDLDQWARITSGTLTIPADVQVIAGSNEPDLCPDQGCATPQEWLVIQHWIDEYYPDVIQFSPSPSPSNRAQWLVAHRTLYHNTYTYYPQWDYLALHLYLYVSSGSAGIITNLDQMISLAELYLSYADTWGLKGVVITEFAVIVFKDTSGDFLYDEGIQTLEAWWNHPTPNGPLGSQFPAIAWYTAHDDPYWGFGPNATTQLYYPDHTLTPLGIWFKQLDIISH